MTWLYLVAAAVLIALVVGAFVGLGYQEWEGFLFGFAVTLALTGVFALLMWLLVMGLNGYVGP